MYRIPIFKNDRDDKIGKTWKISAPSTFLIRSSFVRRWTADIAEARVTEGRNIFTPIKIISLDTSQRRAHFRDVIVQLQVS